MNIEKLSDQTLLKDTKRLVREERELLSSILTRLREIERRRLYSALGLPSLHKFLTTELGYSADEAQRRICAMRIVREFPETEVKINSGALTLTNLQMARAAFNRKDFTREKKVEILKKLENKATREAQQILFSHAPLTRRPDQVKQLNGEDVEIRFTAREDLHRKLDELRGLLAHKYPNLSMGELIERLCDLGLAAWSKEGSSAAPRKGREAQVWKRAGSKCENCGSRYALQVDHRVPKAWGGSDEMSNLRLLCRSCNQRAAIELFGLPFMRKFLERRGDSS